MPTINTRPRKKYTDVIVKKQNTDPELFLITTGPARHVWSWHTISNNELIELIPIFDEENKTLELLEVLQERTLQAAPIHLSRALELFDNKDTLFVVNPIINDYGSTSAFREGPGWKLSLQELQHLIMDSNDNR